MSEAPKPIADTAEPGTADKMKIYLQKALNTFYNPLEFDPNKYFSASHFLRGKPLWKDPIPLKRKTTGMVPKGKPLSEQEKIFNMLGAVGAKSLGAASLAAIAHLAVRKAKNRKQKKNLRRYLNAAFPIMSLDPSTRDLVREKREEEFGIRSVRGLEEEQEKRAQEGPETTEAKFDRIVGQQTGGIVPVAGEGEEAAFKADPSKIKREWGPLSFVMSWFNETLDKAGLIRMPMHPALQLAVPLAVAYSTYRGLDKVLDKHERDKLEKLNDRKRNVLQAMMHSEFERVRGQEKQAEEKGLVSSIIERARGGSEVLRQDPAVPQALGRAVRDPWHFAQYGVPAAFMLWAIASTALAYSVAKKKFDKSDPRRKRMKALERFLRRRAITTSPPMFVTEEGFLRGDPDKKSKKRKRSVKQKSVSVPETGGKEEDTPVDTKDPYADLLK